MNKELICIECPKGCRLAVDIESERVTGVSGNMCPKGKDYAASEIEDPRRVLTSSVLCEGLEVRMLPVRTSIPIPKTRLMEAMGQIKKIRVTKPVKAGAIVAQVAGTNLVATRDADALAM